MTEQKIFDTVCQHLAKQGKPAMAASGECVYRGADGMSCAVGCLFQDDEYSPEMERKSVDDLRCKRLLPPRLHGHNQLLGRLQRAHDSSLSLVRLGVELLSVAATFSLDPASVDLIKRWDV